MSDLAQRIMRAERMKMRSSLSREEQSALRKTREEAKRAGATLATDGEGGIQPSQALGVYRRCEWKCKKCGGKDMLMLHHKANLENPSSKMAQLLARTKRTDQRGIVVICKGCHDAIHDDDSAASCSE